VKYRVTNTHHSPRGLFGANGREYIIHPGESQDIELTDSEAALQIRSKAQLLKLERLTKNAKGAAALAV
jgi:hypothetical protein